VVSVRPALVQPANAAANAAVNVRHMTFENIRTTRPPNDPPPRQNSAGVTQRNRTFVAPNSSGVSEFFAGRAEPLYAINLQAKITINAQTSIFIAKNPFRI
jgi:hypothetical protein